ncbi:peptidylprolyl isomerase [Acidothermus cellulolyticus]|uniref:peptidylprolyl isomerase n=1 Tax=Acidothermus cellulolyticus TaxID=28049 RepID=UPI00006B9066|nr:peptidylprolyl isomerase [Acidothermus cellulolyticus]
MVTALPEAVLHTSLGDITVRLFADHAPHTVQNFVDLALGNREWLDPRSGRRVHRSLYSETVFHRVIAGFMIQGGDPLGTGYGGPGYTFADELHPGLVFDRPYLLAMANAGPHTNGSQFFITVAPAQWLNHKHTIFGEVIAGTEVVERIAQVPTDEADRPLNPVWLHSVAISEQGGSSAETV